jgi:hypothetical protein
MARLRALFALVIGVAIAGPALAADRVPAAGGDIEITPLVHASVQIEHAGKVIQVDPWNLADLSRATPADLILITRRCSMSTGTSPAACARRTWTSRRARGFGNSTGASFRSIAGHEAPFELIAETKKTAVR